MGYRIEYGPMPKIMKQPKRGMLRLNTMTAVCLLLFILTVKHIWPEGTDILRSYLLPGEPTVTEQAANALISDLRNGESFGNAVTVFCREILENGQAD